MTSVAALAARVRKYYLAHLEALTLAQQFYWLSRLWLWGADGEAAKLLRDRVWLYLPREEGTLHQQLAEVLATPSERSVLYHKLRAPVFARYPKLHRYNQLLWRILLTQTVYQRDIRETVQRVVSTLELLQYRDVLLGQPRDVRLLATHAVNYLYFSYCVFGGRDEYVNPRWYLRVAQQAYGQSPAELSLRLYLITHCILGESCFYRQLVSREPATYHALLAIAEAQLRQQFALYSLDLKFEFLVCATLAGFSTVLREQIFEEALHSYAPETGLLLDTHNAVSQLTSRDLRRSEHRNVLFVMATTPLAPREDVSTLPG